MLRLVLFLIGVVALAAGLSWLSDRPGNLVLNWEGYEIETSVFRAVVLFSFLVGLSVFAWSIIRQVWSSPAAVGRFINRRRQERGLDALSSGMIAIGAGDRSLATRYAVQARKALPNEPLTHLLRAQAAQLSGDRATSRRIFEAMLASPDTEQLGLRGLYLEAEREGEREAARQFAGRALELNPKLSWPFEALFDLQCKNSDWSGALTTLATGRRHGQLEKPDADRRRAVLLTAQAQAIEDANGQKALELAQEAHDLAPDLVPAATIAGRQLASRGSTPKAAKIIERTWRRSPHPDLSVVYAHARPGDSPRDRLERIKRLARLAPHSSKGPIAVAQAAVEARNWAEARAALAPLLESRLSPRICTLMARIEGGERQNSGGVREWLARAVNAPRDPAWTAEGMVSDTWAPISPVSGALDAYQWRVPVEATAGAVLPAAFDQLDEFVGLQSRVEGALVDAGPPPEAAIASPSRVAPSTTAANAPAEKLKSSTSTPRADIIEEPELIVIAPATTGIVDARPRSPAARSEASIFVDIVAPEPTIAVTPVARGNAAVKSASAGAANVAGAVPRLGAGAGGATASVSGAIPGAKPNGNSEPRVQTGLGQRPRFDAPADAERRSKADTDRQIVDARVFVPPRAPDDPGLDDPEDLAKPRTDATKPAKRSTY